MCVPQIEDDDTYQYGVRWHDGGISHGWNGATQLDRAQEFIFLMRKTYPTCTVSKWTLVRRRVVIGESDGFERNLSYNHPWEHVDIDPWRKPLTNAVRIKGFRYTWRGLALARIMFAQAESRRRVLTIKGVQQ